MPSVQDEITNWGSWIYRSLPALSRDTQQVIIREVKEMHRTGQIFVRVGGLSGALAVAFSAYGAHVFKKESSDPSLKKAFDAGNHLHLVHSVALLAVPLTRRPYITGPMLATGTLMFCGSCYYHAMTGSTKIRKVTPYGGLLLILAWLSCIL